MELNFLAINATTQISSGSGSRTQYLTGYEPGMIFRFTQPQYLVAGIGIEPMTSRL